MPARVGGLLGFAFAAILGGCLDPAAPSRALSGHLTVYSVIEVGSALARVLAEELPEGGGRLALTGATAVIRGPDGASALAEGTSGPAGCFRSVGAGPAAGEPGCYTGMLPQPVGGGDSLTLEMTTSGGAVVRGALVAPDVPIASIPTDSQRVTVLRRSDEFPIIVVPVDLESAAGGSRVDILPVVDTAYLSAAGAEIDPRACVVSSASNPFRAPPLEGRDDLFIYAVACIRTGARVPWDSVDLAVQVISMDENYAEYTSRILCSGVIASTRAGMGVDGAVGVFGAVAATELRLRLVFDATGFVPPPPEVDVPLTYPC